MYFLIFILGVSASVAAEPISPVRGERIVGGVETSVDKYPFMVQLQRSTLNGWTQFCGGSLISTTTVLTAAHCVDGMASVNMRAVVGTSNTNGVGGTPHYLRPNGIRFHLYYARPVPLDNDIAVLLLDTPVVLSSSVQVIKIAAPNYNLPDGDVVTAIGWGRLSSGGQQPEVLREVDMDVINQEVCAERYALLKENPAFEAWPDITPAMLCAGILDVGGQDACQGDSGGPVINGDVLVGVVSWGYGCADPFFPGVLARVSEFTDWIISNSFE